MRRTTDNGQRVTGHADNFIRITSRSGISRAHQSSFSWIFPGRFTASTRRKPVASYSVSRLANGTQYTSLAPARRMSSATIPWAMPRPRCAPSTYIPPSS
ncbi:MAG TPA: hypothetical protein VFP80_00570 [Thermoanaerobaculia bacterium]|nr:hypothetical protein [Thermoanaerobaculia bacterium]